MLAPPPMLHAVLQARGGISGCFCWELLRAGCLRARLPPGGCVQSESVTVPCSAQNPEIRNQCLQGFRQERLKLLGQRGRRHTEARATPISPALGSSRQYQGLVTHPLASPPHSLNLKSEECSPSLLLPSNRRCSLFLALFREPPGCTSDFFSRAFRRGHISFCLPGKLPPFLCDFSNEEQLLTYPQVGGRAL